MPKQICAISTLSVGVGPGGTTSMLARISVVDFRGQCIYDKYVRPTMKVTEYRTSSTGIKPEHLYGNLALPFNVVQEDVAGLLRGNVIVGHSLWNDLSVLGVPHLAVDTRDVGLYQPFRNALHSPNHIVGLQTLCWQLMCRRCQESELDSLENARAALDLYRSDSKDWEDAIRRGSWPCQLPPSTFSRCYL